MGSSLTQYFILDRFGRSFIDSETATYYNYKSWFCCCKHSHLLQLQVVGFLVCLPVGFVVNTVVTGGGSAIV